MPINKRKKFQKYRGSKTHGGGHMKKRRGSGNRGGFGMAGSGKRADQKKIGILKKFGNEYFGRRGFKRKSVKKEINAINISQLPNTQEVNLKEIGFQKLLSRGTPKLKYKITVEYCSQKAKEKIEKAGGKIILLSQTKKQE